ncbi:MAG TPA: hypothetical protein VF026_23825 [Ktedonobacteraceae bacterium]
MNNSDAEKPSLGETLFELGWQQGTLFSAPSACFSLNKFSDQDQNEPIVQETRKTKPNEKFVLISQDCDIVASEAENDEPNVEAIICKPEKQKFVRRISSRSARWFVIDANSGLVAHAKYRTQFDKKVLSSLTPESWPNGPNKLDEFIRWLARRYDRPSIPDAMHEAFQRPLIERVAELEQENSDVFAAFNRVVEDVRVNIPESDKPPFDLQLILLIKSDGLTVEEANAIDTFDQVVQASLNPNLVRLQPQRTLTEEEISLKEFYASRPIYLADYTYKGEEIDGALPHGRN